MKLSVKDRVILTDVLPQQGSRIEMGLTEDIIERIKITPEEGKNIELSSEGGAVRWNEKKAKEKEVKFSETEINFINESFTKLDKEGKFHRNMLATDKKFR